MRSPLRALSARWFVAALAITVPLSFLLAAGPVRASAPFQMDPAHSSVGFSIRHIFTMVPGRFDKSTAVINFDEAVPENSTVEFTVDASSINTGVDKRDMHLKSPDFFDVQKYPTLTFKSTKIEKTDQPNVYRVTGDFTMVGTTRPLTIQVEVLGVGPDGMGNVRAGFQVTGTVSRKDYWKVAWNKPLEGGSTLLGDDVKLQISVEAVKKAA